MKRLRYLVRINKDPESDWGASVPDRPGCVATGKTIDSTLRRIQVAIELHPWDPIGVADIPEAQDEYNMYASEVVSLLMRGASRQKLIDHLWLIETENMGLPGNRPRTEAAVDRLLQLHREIDGDANITFDRTGGCHALAAAGQRER